MADRRRGLVFGVEGQDDFREFTEFREWAVRKFGEAIARRFTFSTYKDTPQYVLFIQEGEPQRAAELRAETFPIDIGEAGQLGFAPESFAQRVQAQAEAAATADPTSQSEIIETGGFTYIKTTGTGGDVTYTPVGQTPTEGIGAQQLAEQRRQFDIREARLAGETEQQRINALRAQFGEKAAARGLGLIGRSEADIERALEQKFAGQFESFRQQILSGTAPRGFFARQALSAQPNPFTPDPLTIQDKIGGIESAIKAEQTSLKTVRERAKLFETRNLDLAGSGITHAPTVEEFRALDTLREIKEREDRVELLGEQLTRAEDEFVSSGQAAAAQPVARPGGFTVGGGEAAPRPRGEIPIPRGLGEFFPQGIRGELVTPSAQAFGRLSFTEREQLLGGVEFRGGQPVELLEKIQAPLTPRRPGGRVRPIAFV